MATNSAYMKLANRKLVLNLIRKQSISRAEIARRTGLTRAAVSLIMDELIEEGIVVEKGYCENTTFGRRPMCLGINSKHLYAIAIDITKKKSEMGIVSITGDLIAKDNLSLRDIHDPNEAIKQIASKVSSLINKHVDTQKIIGIGISTPGPVDIINGQILNPPNFEIWQNVKVVDLFKEYLDFNIFLDNRSIALTIREKNYGLGLELKSFLQVLVNRAGIGAGLVMNDKIYRGMMGQGSELGHTSIDMNGIRCQCGNIGCLECYASITAVLDRVQQNYPNVTSWEEIVDRAANETFFMNVIKDEGMYLSTAIANCMNLLELEAVVLSGDIIYSPELLIEEIKKHLQQKSITSTVKEVKVLASKREEDIYIISAATIVIEKFFTEGLVRTKE